ncbi:hypothetical protein AF335_07330 [Streptomyces eurocidicus]|uniref:MoaF-like domain-containing protein n=1 Tax=Streptomyces eurocidicus TaxID=66423 RepID=A0A2N8P060_STREU|nr:hypothetical protein [Streptomyces eurocidicus]MBB5118948.1 hypothetical protein [Streptomyces eurocidicus]MBF6051247.1 hypothetical protein [Streptomyces eurocidicus]PNE34407.1 hypothetical protein AF335_07330 [Streptomyces eurocidicus]
MLGLSPAVAHRGTGQDPAEGTVKVSHRELATGVYRLKRTEADGTNVEQAQDWRHRTVRAVIRFEQDGKRSTDRGDGELSLGALRQRAP